ncbi:hypothetical protein NT6N_15730 [Oceaniferula spumae]|uniref:Multidrug resistance protein MdtA-like barrel-sandwich hybrid domain-containing protein n=1 Tax=Oceaniferula spumae TaxID=2979115 RepID=A0AAT9FKR6_9BACT
MKKHNPLGVILGVVIVIAAALVSWWLLRTAPVQESTDKKRSAKIVQTVKISSKDRDIVVTAYGSAIPARQLAVKSQVNGRIISQHPSLIPGGRISKGETLFTIDDTDYQIAVKEAKTARAEAQAEVDLEEGRQTVAKRELEQLREDLPEAAINKALVLREPFKARTLAQLDRANAAVAKAELDLSRTKMVAPFNAVVIDESIETGQLAQSDTNLATLVGSDVYWIQASVPISQLKWIRLPKEGKEGAEATVTLSADGESPLTWKGKVVRLLGDLEGAGRQARVLIEVPKPLDANPSQPLLLGSYVQVKIDAGTLKQVYEIPRAALREGDRIWLVGPEEKLIIRDAEILWRKENTVVIRNSIAEDEVLVVSDIRAPLPGMAVAPELIQTNQKPAPNK